MATKSPRNDNPWDSLRKLASCHPQHITKATAGAASSVAASLAAGGTYFLLVQPDPTALAVPTAVYFSLDGAATANSPLLLSGAPFPVTPDTRCALHVLRVGGSDVTVQVMGLDSLSTTE